MASHSGWAQLTARFATSDATIGVIGLGYVGLPVAIEFAKAGFKVIGVDASPDRVRPVLNGESELIDVSSEDLKELTASGRLTATESYEALADADAVLICVPTPLKNGDPDLGAVIGAGTSLAEVMTPGTLVVLESTTYPGTTEELLQPLLEANGLVMGEDFLLAFSPERIDPGNPEYNFADIPKIVGGATKEASIAAETMYERVVPKVIPVSSPHEAELAKLIENTYRHVNIALVNELAVYAHELGIDIWESIDAAASKPFGFQPFYPGPGWGGHCIPLDPSYLSWRVRQSLSHEVRFVELAQKVGSEMPRFIIERTSSILNNTGKSIKGAKIFGLGVAYKGGTEDTRNSPALEVLERLAKLGAKISYHDPLVAETNVAGETLTSTPLDGAALKDVDLVLILTPQTGIDWTLVAAESPHAFDTCNAMNLPTGGNITRL